MKFLRSTLRKFRNRKINPMVAMVGENAIMTRAVSVHAKTSTEYLQQVHSFKDILPGLVDDVKRCDMLAASPRVVPWLDKILHYNCKGGKMNRGILTVEAYEILKNDAVTSESLKLAAVMGWCVELFQAYILMLDDVMDRSQYRRGAPCWYLQDNVGLSAINDALLVQGTVNILLRKYFSHQPYYTQVVDTFHEIQFKTTMGQYLDWSAAQDGRSDIRAFTMERYNSIVEFKTSHYTFMLPIKLAMLMAGKQSEIEYTHIQQICLQLGRLFQIQDDYLDCFGDSEETGKNSTDIRDGKCCWPAVVALQICSRDQMSIMESYYGHDDPTHERVIKHLYEELNINNLYFTQEKKSYSDILDSISRLKSSLTQKLFLHVLNRMYGRKS